MNYEQQQMAQVAQANKAHEAQQEASTASNILNRIPDLNGDRDRQQFVIKVYSLITMMLGVTAAWSGFVYSSVNMIIWVYSNLWLYYVAFIVTIAIMCGMLCQYEKFRAVPLNYISLGIFTVSHSYLIGALLPQYEPETVVGATLATLAMFVGLTAYACFTKKDITKMGGFLCTLTMMVFMFFILNWLLRMQILHLLLCLAMVCLLSVWIVYDTQLIIGGKKKYQLSLDDYCIGALILYSDIITLFLYMLQLFGGSR